MGIFQVAFFGPQNTRKLRKNSFWALYNPKSTWASVPRNTNRMASARQTTVNRSETKNLMRGSKTILVLRGLDEPGKGVLLFIDHLRVTHQLVKPSATSLRHHCADHARVLTAADVFARKIHQGSLSAGRIERSDRLVQFGTC